MDQLYSEKGGERVFVFFFSPKSSWAQEGTIQAFILLSNWATHEVPHWKIVWMLFFFIKGLIRHLIIWKTLYFKALTHIWLSKVNGLALLKERWRKGFWFFSTPKVVGHNRVPSKHSYYWVSEPLMFFSDIYIIIWKSLDFQALTQIWLSKVNGPALLRGRWRKGFV